jgi:hypothetical protein
MCQELTIFFQRWLGHDYEIFGKNRSMLPKFLPFSNCSATILYALHYRDVANKWFEKISFEHKNAVCFLAGNSVRAIPLVIVCRSFMICESCQDVNPELQ